MQQQSEALPAVPVLVQHATAALNMVKHFVFCACCERLATKHDVSISQPTGFEHCMTYADVNIGPLMLMVVHAG